VGPSGRVEACRKLPFYLTASGLDLSR
jgi:hypothetical protein